MVRIVTDSTCDILKDEQEALGIRVIPLTVMFGDKSYKEGIDLSKEEFYEKLADSNILPKTSQVNPQEFEDAFREIIEDGDEVLCILVGAKLSGTYQSATIAAVEFDSSKIVIIDSKISSIGLALLVKEAVKLRDMGKNLKEIQVKINNMVDKVRLYGVIDTLKYLKLGGRLSTTSAIIGSILGIQPIIEVRDGKVSAVGKARSLKSGLNKVIELIDENPIDYKYSLAYGYSNDMDKLDKALEHMKDKVITDNKFISNIGSVVGTHAGPGVVCIAYISK